MIHYTTGNILAANVEALVNPVNCVGVAGKGLALAFKQAFPAPHKAYAAACETGKIQVGHIYLAQIDTIFNPRWLIHFPTKQHWRDPSRLEWITEGLIDLKRVIEAKGIKSIALPALGCGLGNLRWDEVRQEIEDVLGDVAAEVIVYEPWEERP